jgi:transposase
MSDRSKAANKKRAQFWRYHIDTWSKSGLAQNAYCRANNLKQLNDDPLSGHLFVFCNRNQNIVKILYWGRNGFCLWHKRLEKDRFQWPRSKQEVMTIGSQELAWLMDGLSIHQKKAHKVLKYSTIF